MSEDVSIMGGCPSCGRSPRDVASSCATIDCERCRLVYFVFSVEQLRKTQRAYFAARNQSADYRRELLESSKKIERRVDQMLRKFTAKPQQQKDLF